MKDIDPQIQMRGAVEPGTQLLSAVAAHLLVPEGDQPVRETKADAIADHGIPFLQRGQPGQGLGLGMIPQELAQDAVHHLG